NTSAIVLARWARRAVGPPPVSMNPNGVFLRSFRFGRLLPIGATARRMSRRTNQATSHPTKRMIRMRNGVANQSAISAARLLSLRLNTVEPSHDRWPGGPHAWVWGLTAAGTDAAADRNTCADMTVANLPGGAPSPERLRLARVRRCGWPPRRAG